MNQKTERIANYVQDLLLWLNNTVDNIIKMRKLIHVLENIKRT